MEQLLGEDAAGLSSLTISRLCKDWEAEHERIRTRTRTLRFHRYAYWFVDGVHVSSGSARIVCIVRGAHVACHPLALAVHKRASCR